MCSRPVVTSRVPGPLRRSAPPDAAPRARRHGGSSRSREARRRGPRCSCCSCSGAAAPCHAPTLPFSFYLSASVLIRRLSLLRDPPPAPNGRPARSIPFSTLSEWLCAALEPRAGWPQLQQRRTSVPAAAFAAAPTAPASAVARYRGGGFYAVCCKQEPDAEWPKRRRRRRALPLHPPGRLAPWE